MKKVKAVFYLIMTVAVLFATTQPPQTGNAQSPILNAPASEVHSVPDSIQQLFDRLDKKEAEVRAIIKNRKPKVIYKYITKNPDRLTVYTRINGEVTEHAVKNDDGFYVLDLKPKTETITETYYIDTCIHDKKQTIWRQLFGK